MRDARDGIADIIKTRGFKQGAIAVMAGLTEQQLSDIVNKRRKLDANEMFSICQAMNIMPDTLFKTIQSSTQKGGESNGY